MTHDELRKIVANDDDPKSIDSARGTPREPLFRHWSDVSQEAPATTDKAAVTESSNPNE